MQKQLTSGLGATVRVMVDQVREESVRPVPSVKAALGIEPEGFQILFSVQGEQGFLMHDRGFQGPVHLDSCVEVFLQPPGQSAYLNVECNARGNLHTSWIRDPTRRPEGGFADYRLLSEPEAEAIRVAPGEILVGKGGTDWSLEVSVPFDLFKALCGGDLAEGAWGLNLYKCADTSTHPHWLSWSPCRAKNFHLPEDFGRLMLRA